MSLNYLCIVLIVLSLAGCQSLGKKPDSFVDYIGAEKSIPGVILSAGSESVTVARFAHFFSNVTSDSVRAQIGSVYAENLFFNDTLKTLRTRSALESYLVNTAEHAEAMKVTVVNVARSGANYYVRWTMEVRFKGASDPVFTIGITQLRFNEQGLIVFHQDFWDSTSGFFEHRPVLGSAIRWIKSKI